MVPLGVAPLLAVGISAGVGAGWLPALVVLVVLSVLVRRFDAGIGAARRLGTAGEGFAAGLSITVVASVGAMLLAVVLAQAVAELLVAHPAAIWALPMLAVAVLFGAHLRRPVAWALGLGVLLAGLWGARFEEGSPHGRGYAHSGPIAGIHPFQSTAVVIDGYGPFDLPINDYVEPDGSKGYGPVELAAAIERDLHRIAQLHFADGPARARKAFGEATTDVGEVPQLYDEQTNPFSSGFLVHSGTHGEGSRVEFVCPGQMNDPRPRRRESVMRDSCPTKYAAEGSAGLGVTGRWPGYSEGRGQDRIGIARLMGWTRSADAVGQAWVDKEHTVWVVLLLVGLFGFSRRPGAATAMAATAGVVAILGSMGALTLAVAHLRAPTVGVLESAGSGEGLSWVVLLAALAGMCGLTRARSAGARESGEAGSPWTATVVGVVVLGTVWALGNPAVATWTGRGISAIGLVEHLADALSLAHGIDVQLAEAVLASVTVVVLLAAVVQLCGPVTQAIRDLGLQAPDAEASRPFPAPFAVVGVLALLLPTQPVLTAVAVGLAAVAASAINIAGRRAQGRRVLLDGIVHAVVCVLAVGVPVSEMLRQPPSGVAVGAVLLGGILAVAGLLVLTGRAARPGA